MNVAQALYVFLAHPKNKDIVKWALDGNEWKALQDFEAMLQVLHKYQQATYVQRVNPHSCQYHSHLRVTDDSGKSWQHVNHIWPHLLTVDWRSSKEPTAR